MTLANALRRLNSPRLPGRVAPPRLLLVTDAERLPDPRAAIADLPVGAGVLVRHPDKIGREILARQIMPLARIKRLQVLISEDWRLAARVGAVGVHLPERTGRSGRNAPLLAWARRKGCVVTMACHDHRALCHAAQLKVDACLLSPVFATASHPGVKGLGALRFRMWVRSARVAVIALGGIKPQSARYLVASGAHGLAAIDGLTRSL